MTNTEKRKILAYFLHTCCNKHEEKIKKLEQRLLLRGEYQATSPRIIKGSNLAKSNTMQKA